MLLEIKLWETTSPNPFVLNEKLTLSFFFIYFRFFFDTASGPGNKIIKEAIDDDDQILPLLNGIVMGLLIPYEY